MSLTAKRIGELAGKTERAIQIRAKKEGWAFIEKNGRARGGVIKKYLVSGLPADVQKLLVANMENISTDIIPYMSPEVAIEASMKMAGSELQNAGFAVQNKAAWSDQMAISMDVIRDPRVRRIAGIIQEALDVPAGWKKRKWIEAVAIKHDTTWQTIYKWIKKYEKKGLTGIKHCKKNGGEPRVWTPAAIDWWVGLCLKREHRKIARDALYDILIIEAHKNNWKIGCYESAMWWLNKRVTPQLLALQRGGLRALDNSLPPVLRSYADLAPFEILVGDQHKFDFWVTDDETGEVFRPEGFFWQDLRTRNFYGGAVGKKYNAYMVGLALRIGVKIFGAFNSIYTDNGRPELSRYIMGIMADIKTLGMSAEFTTDAQMNMAGTDAETVNPCTILPGTHKKAIVKNAKAKMIEGSFNVFEGILRDHFHVPGYVKRLTDSGEEQDVDHEEMLRLAKANKLLTFSEFAVKMYLAMDYYNKIKPHRGVKKEWVWKPKPKEITPWKCLQRLYIDGWRPRRLSDEAIDLVFLARVSGGRVVDRGRIHLNNRIYEHDDLIPLSGQRVDLRYDPMDPEWLLIFNDNQYICRAEPVEYSSMKDQDLVSRKIEEKRRLRKSFLTQYRELTNKVPDFREYSTVPAIEKTAALITAKQKAEVEKIKERVRPRTEDQLAAEVALIENYHNKDRPVFVSEVDRYEWCLTQGAAIVEEDRDFIIEYESRMDAVTRQYWTIYKESIAK